MEEKIREFIQSIQEEIIGIRRSIHQNPEVGMETKETAKKVSEVLSKYHIEHRSIEDIGVIAEIRGEKTPSDAVIFLRADMDALPIKEETGLSFASLSEGKMHACGHDIHTSTLLGAAITLNQFREEFSGVVRFVFQPGEEISEGARFMIRNGALDNVSVGFGLHVDPLKPAGVISYREGADWAAVDHFEIKVKGRGAHGATPQNGRDALVAASSLVMNLQTLVSRSFNPISPLLVTIGQFHAGSAYNIISEEAILEGTVRYFDKEMRTEVPRVMERIVKGVCESFECGYELKYDHIGKITFNTPSAVRILDKSAEKVFEKENILEAPLELIGEDFSEYADIVPCVFAHLGADGKYPLHNAHINFREEAIFYGISIEVQFALDALN